MEVCGDFQAGEHLLLCLRPEDITLSAPGEDFKWSPTGKPSSPSSTPAGRNPEQEPPARAGARVEGSSARNRLIAKLVKIIPWGAHYRAELACGDSRLVALITRPSFLELKLHEGDDAVVSFKAAAVHVIRRK